MWIVCITSVRHVLTVNGYGGRQTKENEKSWCFKGWETLVNNRTYLLIGKGNDLYYVDRTTIDRDEPIKLKTFDAEVTALNAETSQGNQLGVGLSNGKFFVLSLKTANLGEILGDPDKKEFERYYQMNGRVFDIRYRFKYSNGWT